MQTHLHDIDSVIHCQTIHNFHQNSYDIFPPAQAYPVKSQADIKVGQPCAYEACLLNVSLWSMTLYIGGFFLTVDFLQH